MARADEELFRGTAAGDAPRHVANLEAGPRHHHRSHLAVFAFAAYFAVVDSLVGRLINKLFETFTK